MGAVAYFWEMSSMSGYHPTNKIVQLLLMFIYYRKCIGTYAGKYSKWKRVRKNNCIKKKLTSQILLEYSYVRHCGHTPYENVQVKDIHIIIFNEIIILYRLT